MAWGRGVGGGEGCTKMVWMAGKDLRGRGGEGSLSLSLRKGGGPTDGTPHIPWKCGWMTWGGGGYHGKKPPGE